ncbi:MAG: MFS transporter [bacterium]|nr:MFS transporter [bacterium]MDE0241485.1 MFS transporter [bacterium]MDE0416358.1 MFS transporter [bacterium]
MRRRLFRDWQGVLKDGWRSPQILLLIFAASIPIAFEPWSALINNFAVDVVNFTGLERGILESVREVPGFLAFTVVYTLLIWRQQTFAILALSVLGLGVALTGLLPTVWGLYFTTMVMSIGFHYLATMEQSLSMQWTSKEELPLVLGRMAAVAAAGSLVAYAFVYVAFEFLDSPYWLVYLISGSATLGLGLFCWTFFPRFGESGYQTMRIVLRRRYWLYYALEFMSGGRRQIFVGFAAFLMVAEFGYRPEAVVALFAANHVIAIWLAPRVGRLIMQWGERPALILEYVGLIGIFVAYAFVEVAWMAAALYILDHLFFALAIAIKSYFRKIAETGDIASTAGVSFTINHIAAVTMPWMLGIIWVADTDGRMTVFLVGAGMAAISLALSCMIPVRPMPGRETMFQRTRVIQPAE